MRRRMLVYVAAVVGFTALILPEVGAQQQTVGEFLKPQTMSYGPISNYGPPQGSANNPPFPYYRVCTQVNAEQISCRKTSATLPSGGGKWFGPWYWIESDQPPVGYQFHSASFHLPAHDMAGKPVAGPPDRCDGDDNSPLVPAAPLAPDDAGSTGHRHGTGAWANCYIHHADSSAVRWYWDLQGQEGGCSGKSWPFTKDAKWLLEIDCRGDGQVFEPVELDVVYVKIPSTKAQQKPH